MIKLEIYIPNDSRFAHSVVERDFVLSVDRERHVYKGKAFTVDEFNAIANDVLLNKKYYKRPTVRAFEVEDAKLPMTERPAILSSERPKIKARNNKVSEEVEI